MHNDKYKVLVIRSIFCPDTLNVSICIEGLINIAKLVSMAPEQFDFSFGIVGWCKKVEMIEEIRNAIKQLPYNIIKFDMWDHNYGKFCVMNQIIALCKNVKYDCVIYSDHDIIFPIDPSLFPTVKKYLSADIVINNRPIGLVAFNHIHDIRHQYDIHTAHHNEYYNIIYPQWSDNFTSIATGAYFARAELFTMLDPFTPLSVYGFDDYYLLKKISDIGFCAAVHKELYILHPFREQNNNYIKWKQMQMKWIVGCIEKNDWDSIEKMYLTNVIESEQVWD
jgi:hypothetical protein